MDVNSSARPGAGWLPDATVTGPVLVGDVGGYWGSPGRPEPCWVGGRGRMDRCGDAKSLMVPQCERAWDCVPVADSKGLWVCAASAGWPWDGSRAGKQEMDSVSLRLATATATLSLCWQAVRPSEHFPVTNLGGAREGTRSKRCVSWVRYPIHRCLARVRQGARVRSLARESRGFRAARGARRGGCEWAE